MFQEETHETVSIDSCVRVESSVVSEEVQTVPCKYEDSEAQAGTVSHAETQTDCILPRVRSNVPYDEVRLAEFLNRICPKVLEELDKARSSRAFDRYTLDRTEEDKKSRKLHSLQPSSGLPIECKLNSMTWSSTGAVLALGYGSVQHDSWCDHRSKIHLFNINRPNFSSTIPNQTLETKSCVTCLRGHLYESSVLAAGLFNGDILVWNLQWEEDCLVGTSETAGGGHEETVVQIMWITDPFISSDGGASKLVLASAGTDGRLILWRLASKTGGLRRGQGFGITSSHLSQLEKGKTSIRPADEFLPITCFSFMPNDSTSFVVAFDNGGLLRCSTLSTKVISGLDPEIILNDPVIGSFKSHNGHIRDIQCSADRHNIFISCSSDGEIRVYNFQQASPLHTIHCDKGVVNGLSWSPSHSGIFLCWSEDSCVYLYDINKASSKPVLCLENNDNHVKVKFAAYNSQSARTVAIADEAGCVNIWYLPESYDGLSTSDS